MPIKIYAVGDMMLGEQPLCDNFGVASMIKRKGTDYLFDDVRSTLADGDIVFGNLECPTGKEKNNDEPIFFCASPDVVEGLRRAHFNVLSVANNHIMEHGKAIFQNTTRLLRENGIRPVGISKEIDFLTIRGCKIAFMGYSFIEDAFPDSQHNKIRNEEQIIIDLQKIRSLADIMIISLHWGHEYVPCPSPDQVRIGRKLIDAGADIILGGHPHVTQSYEMYKGRPIIYSLGNFIFDHAYIPATTESFIAEISISDSFDVLRLELIPVVLNGSDYRPQIVKPPRSDRYLASILKVNALLQDRSLSAYQDEIGDYGALIKKHKKAAKRKMRVHFLKSVHRYSLSTTLGMIRVLLNK